MIFATYEDYSAKPGRIFDFLNMETYLADAQKCPVSSSKPIWELGCLKGAKMAYDRLISEDGTPPEIIWPNNLDDPIDLTKDIFKPANGRKPAPSGIPAP